MSTTNSFRSVTLSYPISTETPLYGSMPAIECKTFSSLEKGQSANSILLSIHNHCGTHIECPRHFIPNGKCLTDYAPEEFKFNSPLILDIPSGEGELITCKRLEGFSKDISTADIILLGTGFWRFRKEQKYKTHNPGITVEAFQFLRSNFHGLRAVGIDTISISSFLRRDAGRMAHREAFRRDSDYGEPLLLIEDVNLMDAGPFDVVLISPIFLLPIDASPVVITALKAEQ